MEKPLVTKDGERLIFRADYNVENWTIDEIKVWLYDYDFLPEDLKIMGYDPFKVDDINYFKRTLAKKLIERQIIKNSLSESKATELITVLNLIKWLPTLKVRCFSMQ